MNFETLLNQLRVIESHAAEAVLDKPYDSYLFGDQVSGTEKAKSIQVLGSESDPHHPFQGRLVGADESVDADLNEDLIAQLTQEFADFLRDKQPVMDNILPAAQSQELGKKPQDRTLTAEAEPAQTQAQQPTQPATQQPAAKPAAQQPAAPAAQQPAITNIAGQLSKLLGIDATKLKAAYQAPKPSAQQLMILATAFKKLAAADPQVTVKAMTLLKKIEAEQPVAGGQ